MLCPKCGTDVPEGYKFCETCGNNMQAYMQQTGNQEQPATNIFPEEPSPQPAYQPQPQVSAFQQPQRPAYQPQPQPMYQRPQPIPVQQGNTYIQDETEKPYSVGGWLLTFLVMIIPIVNIIMPFVWAFSSRTNKSKKNFFIAYLIIAAIGIILGIVFAASLAAMIDNFLQQLGDFGDLGGDLYLP